MVTTLPKPSAHMCIVCTKIIDPGDRLCPEANGNRPHVLYSAILFPWPKETA